MGDEVAEPLVVVAVVVIGVVDVLPDEVDCVVVVVNVVVLL